MSMLLTRSPLVSIGMNSGGAQKRRSARLSQETNAENEPATKKVKVDNSNNTIAINTKQLDGDAGKASGKRKRKVYNEEVEGFAFTKGGRAKGNDSKKAPVRDSPRAEAVAATGPPAANEARTVDNGQSEPVTDDAAPKTTQKKSRRRLPTTPDGKSVDKPARRSKRLSNEEESEPTTKRLTQSKSHITVEERFSPNAEDARPVTVEKKRKHGSREAEKEKVMTISLPFADTPIIRRNKEMRKNSADGNRRSSAGMRGRRASSLIGEGRGHEVSKGSPSPLTSTALEGRNEKPQEQRPGLSTDSEALSLLADAYTVAEEVLADIYLIHTALPHDEVPASEFFKHISAELTEPRRMRCLLGWCGTRSVPPKPDPPGNKTESTSLEFQAQQAACILQQELSQDLITQGILSDWFSRDDSAVPSFSLRKKPNPRNVANAAKAEELERELERLKRERAEWDAVVQSTAPAQPDVESDAPADGQMSPLRLDVLDDGQQKIYEQLEHISGDATMDAEQIQRELRVLSENLEFAVDQFAHGIHTLSTTKQTAERVAEKYLAGAATALDEKDKQRLASGKPVDQMDALRGLARVLNAHGASNQ